MDLRLGVDSAKYEGAVCNSRIIKVQLDELDSERSPEPSRILDVHLFILRNSNRGRCTGRNGLRFRSLTSLGLHPLLRRVRDGGETARLWMVSFLGLGGNSGGQFRYSNWRNTDI